MNWLKRKLRGWLVPEYEALARSKEKMDLFMEEIARAKVELQSVDKNITIKNPAIFLGSLQDCKINLKPTIKPEITLAKVDIPAALIASGNHQLVNSCLFKQEPTAIKLQEK